MSFIISVPDIHQGPGFLWFGVSVPASGSRLIIDGSGTPTQGSPLAMGASEGKATFELMPKIEEIKIDQETGPVDAVMTEESGYIEVELKETNLNKISKALAHSTYSSGTDTGLPAGAQNYEELTVGGLIALPQNAVALISQRRGTSSPGKFLVCVLYNAVAKAPYQVGFTRTKESIYKVRFDALAVLTRTVGDRIGQYYRQT